MRGYIIAAALVVVMALPTSVAGQSAAFADPAFLHLWSATDAAVAVGTAPHSWIWGPAPRTAGLREPYAESPGGERLVQYFDKGRMELTRPGAAVTSGLLARELMTGLVQTGDHRYDTRAPADIPIAGDLDDATAPTYAALGLLIGRPALEEGTPVTNVIDRSGSIGADGVLSRHGVRTSDLVPETQHRLANVFRAYFSGEPLPNTEGQLREVAPFEPWYATTGLPITEPYWARVRVAGELRDVLVQGFERRVLTYTPSNPAGSQVEMGNVGQHHLAWRAAPAPVMPELACPAVPDLPLAGRAQHRLTILGSALHVVGDRRAVAGRIRNDGDSRSPVEVVVTRLTADGRRLGLSTGFTDREFWPNGQVAGFRIALPPTEALADWRVEVRTPGGRPSGGLAGGFAIEDLRGEVDGLGVTRVSGQLRYAGPNPFSNLAMVRIHALDACGGLVAIGATRAGQGTLQPGSVTPFDAVIIAGEGASRLQAVVEARVGTTSFVADDALVVYHGGLFPAPRVPITAVEGCCQYTRAYQRPNGTPVQSIFRLTAPS
ncbi:MAG: hypothetical protein IT340_03165 [Chloroflexi bacterium]|nr:hypothetical protein [Chloroflexota bacterium]